MTFVGFGDTPFILPAGCAIDFFPCPQALRFDVFAFYSVTSGAATGLADNPDGMIIYHTLKEYSCRKEK